MRREVLCGFRQPLHGSAGGGVIAVGIGKPGQLEQQAADLHVAVAMAAAVVLTQAQRRHVGPALRPVARIEGFGKRAGLSPEVCQRERGVRRIMLDT